MFAMESQEKLLQSLGLSDKESSVYLALLELGASSVLRIAEKADVKRPTAYVVLEALMEKELVKEIKKKTTTLYVAEDPEAFAARLKQNLERFNEMLPAFKDQYDASKDMDLNREIEISNMYAEEPPSETVYFHGTSVKNEKGGKVRRKKVSGFFKLYDTN